MSNKIFKTNTIKREELPASAIPKSNKNQSYIFRAVKVGAGIVILPRLSGEDYITENELKKALHFTSDSFIEPKTEPKKEVYHIRHYPTNDSFFVKMTEEQADVFAWFSDNIYDDFGIDKQVNFEIEEI